MKSTESIKPGEMEAEKMLRASNIDTSGLFVVVRHTKDKDGERSVELEKEYFSGVSKCSRMDCPLRDKFCNSAAFNLRNAENAVDSIVGIIKQENEKRYPPDTALFIYITENQAGNLQYLFDCVGDTGLDTKQGAIYEKLENAIYDSKFSVVYLGVWDCENNKYYVTRPTIFSFD